MPVSVLPALVSAEEAERQLPMPAAMYGILFMVGFLLLLALVWSFRGTAYKIRDRHARPGGGAHPPGGGH